jgi:hypothetical protein
MHCGSALCPSSGIKKLEHDFTETGSASGLKRREEDAYSHDFTETGSASGLKRREKTPTLLGP